MSDTQDILNFRVPVNRELLREHPEVVRRQLLEVVLPDLVGHSMSAFAAGSTDDGPGQR